MTGNPKQPQQSQDPDPPPEPQTARRDWPDRKTIVVAVTMAAAVAGIARASGLPVWAEFLATMATIALVGMRMKPMPPRQLPTRQHNPEEKPQPPEPPQQ